jgi:hypothetical protein
MRRSAFILIGLILVALAGCGFFPFIEGSGFLVHTDYAFTDFVKITADHAFNVSIVPDSVFSVTVTCDDNIVTYLNVYQQDDRINFGLSGMNNYSSVTLNAEVHMPGVTSLELSGASDARIQSGFSSTLPVAVIASGASTVDVLGLASGPLSVEMSGGSQMTVSSLTATSLTAELSGGSSLSAAGSASSESITASGGSSAYLLNLLSDAAGVELSGGSEAWINAGSGLITLRASGGSVLYYTGTPLFNLVELSGGSEIRRVN